MIAGAPVESSRFDALTRTVHSRRTALAVILGSLAALLGLPTLEASAHNPVPSCQKIKDPKRRQTCLRLARRHNKRRHSCKQQPRAVTCANRCGSVRNNCRKTLNCICPSGKLCLSNGSCSRPCSEPGFPGDCPQGCQCGPPALEGGLQCAPDSISDCPQIPLVCTSTKGCPPGHYCSTPIPLCSSQRRCIPVCSA